MELEGPGSMRTEFDRKYANSTLIYMAAMVVIVLYVEGMLTPSLPAIAREFGVTSAQVSLVLALYLVSGTAMAPVLGKLGDIYGKKRILTYVLIVYSIAVTTTGFSPTFEFMLASRMVQGCGLGVMPLAMTLIREEFPRDLIPRSQAIISAMFGVGAAVSIPIGAYVSNSYGWQFTYHTAIPFVVLITIVVIYRLRESRYTRQSKIDYAGAAALAASLGMVVLGLSLAPSRGWTDMLVLLLLVVGLLAIVPLAIYERRSREPILNLRLLRQRNVLIPNLVVLANGLGMFLAMQTVAFRFESPPPSGYGYNIFDTGLSIVPFAGAQLVFAPIAGFVVTRTGVKPISVIGAAMSAASFLFAAMTTTANQLYVAEFFAGGGLSFLNASVINLLILTVETRELALVTSMNTVFRTLGSSMGAPIAGTILASYTIDISVDGSPTLQFPSHAAYDYCFLIAAAVFAAVILILPFALEVLGKRTKAKLVPDTFQTKLEVNGSAKEARTKLGLEDS